jgi:hypothetical protein
VTISPTPRHLCSALFISSQVTETSHSLIILIPETTPSSTCLAFSPSSAATPFAATFHSPPVAETPIVSNFFIRFPEAETPLFSILFIPFPSSFPLPNIDETIPSSNCFASFVAETPFTSNFSSFSSMMLKHRRSAPSDFLPILKHQLSAVLHRKIFRSFSVAATPAFHRQQSLFVSQRQYKQQAVT